jgi:serine/threonine protein kinase
MSSKLIVLAGPDEGVVFPLGSEVVLLGRSRATETHLTDPHVSRVHCQIVPEGGQHVVVDFDSASGTFVNGKEIERHVLKMGDLIRIGATHLQYAEEESAPTPTVAPIAAPPPKAPAKPANDWAKGLIGQTLSHFAITAPLARSKTGYVFHARDTRNETAVALKVLPPEFSLDEKKVQNFVDAMKTVMPLGHPHLLKIYGAGRTGNHCWVATEYIPGDSLSAVIGRIQKSGKIDWKAVVRVGIYLVRALEYAHQKNLIHQNVTPQNILVGRKPQNTKLTDLMLALATDEDPTKPISDAGLPAESLGFMSPERTDGPGAAIDGRTDLYSLAATLFAMLTGRPPFQAGTVDELMAKIRLDAPPALNIQAPDALEKLLRRTLAKRPQDRPATATELRKELEALALEHKIPL